MEGDLSRRDLLKGAAGALVAAWHAPLMDCVAQGEPYRAVNPGQPLMRRIKLQTAAPIGAMEEFYCGTLGLPKTQSVKGELSFQAGGTLMTFVPAERRGDGPLTHFAFNIPQNKIRPALEWAKKRLDLIPAWGDLADPAYPNEVIHFRHWNARSVFFWDPAYNLVELIARHDLKNDAKSGFSPADIICTSEIGLASAKPADLAKLLNKDLGIPAYPRGTAPAFAMGDENGLLLCLKEAQVWGEHTPTPKKWGVHPTELEIAGNQAREYRIPNLPFLLRVTS